MAKYIPLDALVAEIENIRKHYIERDDFDNGWNYALNKVLSFLDTLEVKEVGIEKEIDEHAIYMPMSEFTHESEVEDFHEWAREEFRYFFELGLNASNPLTWEDVKKICVQSVLVEIDLGGKVSDERHYTEVLKRFKAQKGE